MCARCFALVGRHLLSKCTRSKGAAQRCSPPCLGSCNKARLLLALVCVPICRASVAVICQVTYTRSALSCSLCSLCSLPAQGLHRSRAGLHGARCGGGCGASGGARLLGRLPAHAAAAHGGALVAGRCCWQPVHSALLRLPRCKSVPAFLLAPCDDVAAAWLSHPI